MLLRLLVQNVVLIKSLSLDFGSGLTVLTGETGAGKSILLDALSLALGARSDTSLVRRGSDSLSVSAEFQLDLKHPVRAFLAENGFPGFDLLILRRTVGKQGVSRAFINDHAVSVKLLKETSAFLAEIYAQFAVQELFSPSEHLLMLDTFAGLDDQREKVRTLYTTRQLLLKEIEEKKQHLQNTQRQEEYLSFAISELEDFNLLPDEEEQLEHQRDALRHEKQIGDALRSAERSLSADGLFSAMRALESVQSFAQDTITPILDLLSSVQTELDEAGHSIALALSNLSGEGRDLEEVNDRYFALKDLYRKYRVNSVEELIDYLAKARSEKDSLRQDADAILLLEQKEKELFTAYETLALDLRQKRHTAAVHLEEGVTHLLPSLKMQKAVFKVQVTDTPPGLSGMDQVVFLASMNAGGVPGSIHKIASGGELSRLLLALKVNLSAVKPTALLIFDEIDAGVSGATASAVGVLLAKLSRNRQVMVITHSPQITAYSDHHFKVIKEENSGVHLTDISALGQDGRIEELARMLSGEKITPEARSAARSLLDLADRPS